LLHTFRLLSQQSFRFINQIEHTWIFDLIINAQAIFAILDNSGLAKEHELLGYVCLSPMQRGGQMANTFFARAQQIEDLQTSRMTDRFE
jgi:hypothetical protein